MSETHKIHDPFLGKTVEISSRLVDRLRGKYACGPILPNGEPEFGWRQHEAPPIQHEAAAEIERLRTALAQRMPDYTAWLIEINEPVSGPIYFQFEHDNDWTINHDRACHFSRKRDAEDVIIHYGWTEAKAVQHMWPALPSTPGQAAGKTDGGAS